MTLPIHDPVLIVAIAMAAFLIMPLLTERLHLPDIIGIVLAGVIVGPHGLGLLERDETIQLLGTVGLLYLVFLAGLEVDLGDLSRKRRRAITFGIITFLVPQVVGTLGAFFLFDFENPWASAILLGSVFSSHSFLALLIAKRMNLTERELVIAVIGGTVITDTLALFVLALVAQSTGDAFNAWFILQLLVQTIIFATVVVFGIPLIGRWFFKRVTDGSAHFTFMMTLLFTCGYVAHLAGLEPIIGAFLSGLAMNRLVPHSGALANRAFFFGNTIFVPFFLLSVGMLIDLSMVFGDLQTIEMALFMCATVIICKGIAAWCMRLIFGYSRDDVVVAWGLSLPQAATTLAVVLVGYDLALFDESILNATIVMVFVTCFLGPILVQISGRRIADAAPHHAPTASEASHQRILLPLANPSSSHNLLDMAVAMRRPLVDDPILPMSVASSEDDVATSEKLLADSVLHLAASDVPVRPVIRVDLNAANGILRAMRELRASSLIVGWNGPQTNWQRHFHLSRGLIDELITDTTNQLLVVRLTRPLSVIERIVLVIPNHASSEFGFAELIGDCKLMAKRIGASVLVSGEVTDDSYLREEIERITPIVSIEYDQQKTSQELPEHIGNAVTDKDLVFIVGCREGTASWNTQWNRLPPRLAHHAANTSLVIAYPRIGIGQNVNNRSDTKKFTKNSGLIENAVFLFKNQQTNLAEIINETLPKMGQNPSDSLCQQLMDTISALSDSVALMHIHTDKIDKARLAVVFKQEPLEHNGLNLRIILILLNPLGVSAEDHLANLGSIAQIVRDEDRIKQAIKAHDDDNTEDSKRLFIVKP